MVGEETVIGTMASGALDTGVIVIVGVLFISIVAAIAIFFMYQRKWGQFECRVWKTDAFGQVVEVKDKAGIFVDKVTNSKRFYLKKHKSSLGADNVPVIYIGNKKIVYVRQIGLKNFEYVTPENIFSEVPLKVVSESDVNWAVNDYERQKNVFGKDKWLQYLPFIALGIVAIVIMIIFIYFFKKLDVLQEFGASLVRAAEILNPSVIQ